MGFILALLCTFLNSAKDLFSKKLSFLVDGTTSTFASFAFALPFYLILFVGLQLSDYQVASYSSYFWLLVILRTLSDAGAEWTKMQALSYGEISYLAPFMSLAPLFLLIFSPLITGDPLTNSGIIGIILSMMGSWILIDSYPSEKNFSSAQIKKGVVLALMTSFFFSLNTCFDRLAVQIASPVFSGFTMTLLAAIFFLPAVISNPNRINSMKLAATPLLIRGVLEVSFMVTKLFALTYLQAPYVAAITRLSLLILILGGYFFFNEGDLIKRLLAGMLVICGALIVIIWP